MHVLYIHLFSSLCFFWGGGTNGKTFALDTFFDLFRCGKNPPHTMVAHQSFQHINGGKRLRNFFAQTATLILPRRKLENQFPVPRRGGGRSLITPTVIQPRQPRLEWSLTNVLPISIFYIFAHQFATLAAHIHFGMSIIINHAREQKFCETN